MAIVQIQDPQTTELDITNSIIYGRGIPAGFGPMDDGEGDHIAAYILPPLHVPLWRGRRRELHRLHLGHRPDAPVLIADGVYFSLHPLPDSPAIDAADPALDLPQLPAADMRGNPRGATLEHTAPRTKAKTDTDTFPRMIYRIKATPKCGAALISVYSSCDVYFTRVFTPSMM